MNVELNLTIPLLNNLTNIKVTTQLLLYPFYCTEEDVANPFEEFEDNKSVFVRQIIFNNSIKVLTETKKLEMFNILAEEDLFALRREYTICLSTYEMTKKMKIDYIGTISRSKKLGDFEVSTSKKTEGAVLDRLLADTKDCVQYFINFIKELESEKILPQYFAKASKNITSTYPGSRLWWLSGMTPNLTDAFASSKVLYNSKQYKVGNFNARGNYVPESRTGFTEGNI